MFQDPGECHALKLPEKEHNQWLRRANRAAGNFSQSASGGYSAAAAAAAAAGSSSSSPMHQTTDGVDQFNVTPPPGSPRSLLRSPITGPKDIGADGEGEYVGKRTGGMRSRACVYSREGVIRDFQMGGTVLEKFMFFGIKIGYL